MIRSTTTSPEEPLPESSATDAMLEDSPAPQPTPDDPFLDVWEAKESVKFLTRLIAQRAAQREAELSTEGAISQQLQRPAGLTQDEEPSGLARRFATEHAVSMQEHRPHLYSAMQQAGTLAAHCRLVGESADAMYRELMEPAMQEAAPLHDSERKLAILDTARIHADSRVMRELVLVAEQDTDE